MRSPPTRSSSCSTSVRKPSGAHQLLMPSGVVHSCQTRSRVVGMWRSMVRMMSSFHLDGDHDIFVTTNVSRSRLMDFQRVLVAIAEPQRYRIVTLLAEGPRTVGEIASALSALQPQTTKHLQALESAGVIAVHRLGRRRLASLERQTLRSLAEHLGELA